jgi:hypothetical protein
MFFFSANVFEKKFKINHKNTFKASLWYFLVKIADTFLLGKQKINCAFSSDKIKKRNRYKERE